MTDKTEKETLADSLNKTLEKSKGIVFTVAAIIVVAIVAVAVFATLKSKATEKGIEQFDLIAYNLTNEAKDLSADDIAARQTKALEDLTPLTEKKGIVGVRANMLFAEIKFSQKKYDEARSAWLKAVSGDDKIYTAPLCYYNAAVCSEELGDTDSAISCYKSASEADEFVLVDHALFSLGRVNEGAAKYADAKAAYDKLISLHPSSNWAELSKSRLIALKAAGKIE
ncbi:tetratricopeptide repeat protein [uncultured Treponema sp.]|uniref:tetratricopeptide repeat protein n=1 Tax=uncultured Treponema sp. TaxID=162155 RepID=UPI0025E90887|nr:tetratricopeptide repeat protein [uncultured Treponema sp.]